MNGSTVERALGRWREILPRLGVKPRFLVNRLRPCPICGGKDRFRFDDRNGSGSYYCSQCGAGTGIIMLRKLNGWDHATACREIDKIIGTDWVPIARTTSSQTGASDRLAKVERLLGEANSLAVVDRYLGRRGLSVSSPVLRGHESCPFYGDDDEFVGRYPAVVAPITGAGRQPAEYPAHP
jgi:putative DNA primase/helicase